MLMTGQSGKCTHLMEGTIFQRDPHDNRDTNAVFSGIKEINLDIQYTISTSSIH
jgi:hypothetical protein